MSDVTDYMEGYNVGYQEGYNHMRADRDQALEEAARVVDTATCADPSLAKLAMAIRELKDD
jgi:hypothetical protein